MKVMGFPWGSAGKESTCNVGDLVSIPGLRRSPGEGKGYPLQYSGLENSMHCIVHGVADTTEQVSLHKWKSCISSTFEKSKNRFARRSNQSILKEISPGCSLEEMMLKLKLQYFDHLMRRVDSLEKAHAGRDWGQEEKGTTEDEMAGWHHQLDGQESEWTLGVGDGQGGLACCDSWGRRVGHNWATEMNWTELSFIVFVQVFDNKKGYSGNGLFWCLCMVHMDFLTHGFKYTIPRFKMCESK